MSNYINGIRSINELLGSDLMLTEETILRCLDILDWFIIIMKLLKLHVNKGSYKQG